MNRRLVDDRDGMRATARRSRMHAIVVTAAAAAALLLAGCGQKGPLFLPGYPKEAQWPYPPRPPKAPADDEKQRRAPAVPPATDDSQ